MKPEANPPTRVLLVEDHDLMRKALRTLLEAEGRFAIVGEAADAAAALQLAADTAPELAIMDISLKGPMNGLELTAHLKFRHPSLKVLVLSLYAAAEWAERARDAGADGYLSKVDAAAFIPTALAAIRRGGHYGF